jgi:hypothetical protein
LGSAFAEYVKGEERKQAKTTRMTSSIMRCVMSMAMTMATMIIMVHVAEVVALSSSKSSFSTFSAQEVHSLLSDLYAKGDMIQLQEVAQRVLQENSNST